MQEIKGMGSTNGTVVRKVWRFLFYSSKILVLMEFGKGSLDMGVIKTAHANLGV